jgi:hypothetical protein
MEFQWRRETLHVMGEEARGEEATGEETAQFTLPKGLIEVARVVPMAVRALQFHPQWGVTVEEFGDLEWMIPGREEIERAAEEALSVREAREGICRLLCQVKGSTVMGWDRNQPVSYKLELPQDSLVHPTVVREALKSLPLGSLARRRGNACSESVQPLLSRIQDTINHIYVRVEGTYKLRVLWGEQAQVWYIPRGIGGDSGKNPVDVERTVAETLFGAVGRYEGEWVRNSFLSFLRSCISKRRMNRLRRLKKRASSGLLGRALLVKHQHSLAQTAERSEDLLGIWKRVKLLTEEGVIEEKGLYARHGIPCWGKDLSPEEVRQVEQVAKGVKKDLLRVIEADPSISYHKLQSWFSVEGQSCWSGAITPRMVKLVHDWLYPFSEQLFLAMRLRGDTVEEMAGTLGITYKETRLLLYSDTVEDGLGVQRLMSLADSLRRYTAPLYTSDRAETTLTLAGLYDAAKKQGRIYGYQPAVETHKEERS